MAVRIMHAVLIIVLILAALIVAATIAIGAPPVMGGARPRATEPAHIVVDTLNLTHWLGKGDLRGAGLTLESVLSTIEKTASVLRAKYPGRVMYVVKDRESVLNDSAARVAYADAAMKHSVYIYAVERYENPPTALLTKSHTHSAKGRDDLYMALLAGRWKCPVLTEDRFRDFDEFRADVGPFHVYEFAFWRALPSRDYVRPSALRALKKPRAVRYEGVIPKK